MDESRCILGYALRTNSDWTYILYGRITLFWYHLTEVYLLDITIRRNISSSCHSVITLPPQCICKIYLVIVKTTHVPVIAPCSAGVTESEMRAECTALQVEWHRSYTFTDNVYIIDCIMECTSPYLEERYFIVRISPPTLIQNSSRAFKLSSRCANISLIIMTPSRKSRKTISLSERSSIRANYKLTTSFSSGIHPIRCITPEILTCIFLQCLPDGYLPRQVTSEAPLLLVRVCNYWYTLAYRGRGRVGHQSALVIRRTMSKLMRIR